MLPSNEGSEPARSLNTENTTACSQWAEKVIIVKQFTKSVLNTITRKWQSFQSYIKQQKEFELQGYVTCCCPGRCAQMSEAAVSISLDSCPGLELQKVSMYYLLTFPFFGNQLRTC